MQWQMDKTATGLCCMGSQLGPQILGLQMKQSLPLELIDEQADGQRALTGPLVV